MARSAIRTRAILAAIDTRSRLTRVAGSPAAPGSAKPEPDDRDDVAEPQAHEASDVRGGLGLAAPPLAAAVRDLADPEPGPSGPVQEVDAVLAIDVVGPDRHSIEDGPARRDEARGEVANAAAEHQRGESVDEPARHDAERGRPRIATAGGVARADGDVCVGEARQQRRNVSGRHGAVGIEPDDRLALRLIRPFGQCRRKATAADAPEHSDP